MKVDSKKKQSKNHTTIVDTKKVHKYNKKIIILVIFLLGVFLIFSTYAWFSTNLNVRINTFKMSVERSSGLMISFDGINFDSVLEINADTLINDLKNTYPDNVSQWATNGLVPVSSNGNSDANSYFFDIYYSPGGVLYSVKDKERRRGFISTTKAQENQRRNFSRFIAFDLFFKNDTASPIADNLYLDTNTFIRASEDATEEIAGLVNSTRIGIIKVGSTSLEASAGEIQGLTCNNNCQAIIYDPNSKDHSPLSIERAQKYGITLVDGEKFPTYGNIRSGNFIYVANTISGSPNLDRYYFDLQGTMTEDDLTAALFTIPSGITKTRIYLWIEGQDIDSLETDSEGAELEVAIGFYKDTAGNTELDN